MEEYYFKMNDNETYTIMGYRGDLKEIEIPSTYAGKPVTILFDSLFKGHDEIIHVTIPKGIEDIGGFLFDGCNHLKKIDLPEGLKNIWQYAFVRTAIEEIILPDTLSTIPPFSFKDCKKLKTVVCGKGLKKIHGLAFQGCESLQTVFSYPDIMIEENAFDHPVTIKTIQQ